jgi:hypothetical protein
LTGQRATLTTGTTPGSRRLRDGRGLATPSGGFRVAPALLAESRASTTGQECFLNPPYLAWLGSARRVPTAAQAQRRFNVLRLRFNTIIRHFDVFASVLGQRSEHETGVWVAGLDDVAADALALPGGYFVAPPMICYLDRTTARRSDAPIPACPAGNPIRSR